MAEHSGMVDPVIFEFLQAKVDQESAISEELQEIVTTLEKQVRSAKAILSRAHSTPVAEVGNVITAAESSIRYEIDSIEKLSKAASEHPYYKWQFKWTHQVQDTIFTILFCGWLGGYTGEGEEAKPGKLLTIEEVGKIMKVPVNLKDRDAFHITIQEYLLSLVSLLDELARLARNCVTLGDYRRPLQISNFLKDVQAGFLVLNLKNDILRRRSDGIKYKVKEVEDVVYDLSLRNLLPAADT
ncbi:Translin [Aulographum hederae CBS 113979]|uniref:Translin n=1 Tax=Aulographum hederae CBS 113979 TaxID=1176131 RepID=A0A6G1HAJ0_9PEZI|nr:Translin [Aulographum hederae CBS 113979]